jgi:hypothetical protein
MRTILALTLTALIGASRPGIASSSDTPREPAAKVVTETDAAVTKRIVWRLYQATFGASARCKMALPESAGEFETAFDRFSEKYPNLLNLLRSSPYYESARQSFLQASTSRAAQDTPQSLAAECKGLAQLLRSMIDEPEGQKAVRGYIAQLTAE